MLLISLKDPQCRKKAESRCPRARSRASGGVSGVKGIEMAARWLIGDERLLLLDFNQALAEAGCWRSRSES